VADRSPLAYFQARAACQDATLQGTDSDDDAAQVFPSHLLQLFDEQELDIVVQLLGATTASQQSWIGARGFAAAGEEYLYDPFNLPYGAFGGGRRGTFEDFVSSLSSPRPAFRAGEPSSAFDQCVAMAADGLLSDFPCEVVLEWVCKRPVPAKCL